MTNTGRPPNPIRVCFLIDRLTRGGTETQLLALIRAVDRSRVEPALVLLDGTDDESRSLEPADCPVLRLGLQALGRPAALAAAAALTRFWRRHRTDVLQVYFPDSAYFGVPLARLAGVPRVVRVRNNLGHWLTPRHRWLGRVMGRLVDTTLTNCEPARQALIQAEGGPARKIVVLENGVDLDRFLGNPKSETRNPKPGMPVSDFGFRVSSFEFPKKRVGAVANLRPVKAIDLFIRAAACVLADHPGATFHVAGEGSQRPELEQLIAELGLTGRFILHGVVVDVPAFLESLDVAVLCSHAEGMSNAILEAMAAGRPVVATDVGANGHLLRGGELGVLVPPGDESALAAAIGRLLDEPTKAARLGEQARRHVQTHYSRDAMRRRFEDFYTRLCA